MFVRVDTLYQIFKAKLGLSATTKSGVIRDNIFVKEPLMIERVFMSYHFTI